jgi:hypothetical protein
MLLPILHLQKDGLVPLRTRNKINELASEFLAKLRDDAHDMLCGNFIDADNCGGLDSDCDTKEEVENIIRFFPEVLTTPRNDDEENNLYPIMLLAYADGSFGINLKSVSSIPLVAGLAVEYGLFEEELKGGLLCINSEGENVLDDLMRSDTVGGGENRGEQHEIFVDDAYLDVIIELRQMGLLKKEDIQSYDLLMKLCVQSVFLRKRSQFLVEWDPTTLLVQTDENNGCLPLHIATLY